MGGIILTGISYNGHKFEMVYIVKNGDERAYAVCICGYRTEFLHFRGWAGTQMLQKRWEDHKVSLG